MVSSFIEFEVLDNDRFSMLARVFEALRTAKVSGVFPPDDYWLRFFDQAALSHFWWPSEQELHEFDKQWTSTPVQRRLSEPALQRPWHFGSMLEAIRDGEYNLLTCEQNAQSGRLEFEILASPYGGLESLKALVEAFGFRVTLEVE